MFRPHPGTVLIILACLLAIALLSLPALAAPVAQEGQAVITAPQANAQVAGVVQITGSASHPQFARYELAWAAEPITGDNWGAFLTAETPVENGVLALWNTTQVPDGVYALRLRVVRQDGNYAETVVRGIRITNTRPTETPTPPLQPTIPPEATSVEITPTPELIIQPPTSTPSPPTATPASTDASSGDTLGRLAQTSFSINLAALGKAFVQGIVYTFGLFAAWGALLSVRGIIRWTLRRLAQQKETQQRTNTQP